MQERWGIIFQRSKGDIKRLDRLGKRIEMKGQNHFKNYIKELKVRGHSEKTIQSYENDLKQFLDFLEKEGKDLEGLGREEVKNYIYHMNRLKYKGSSISRKLSSIKGFMKKLIREGVIGDDLILMIERRKYQKPLPAFLNRDDIRELRGRFDMSKGRDIRDRAIFEVLYSTGMRVSELVGIEMGDLKLEEGVIRVNGKGDKERLTFLTEGCEEVLREYEGVREGWGGEGGAGYLFIKEDGEGMKSWDIFYVIRRRTKELKVGKKIGPHTFRHSFATHLLDNGADIRSVQELLGHKDLTNTQIYTHVSREKLRKIYEESHPHGK